MRGQLYGPLHDVTHGFPVVEDVTYGVAGYCGDLVSLEVLFQLHCGDQEHV